MISKVSFPIMLTNNIQLKKSPSFGMAALNENGRRIADSFGYTENKFLNPNMYRKQGLFHKSMLSRKISDKENFVDICREYGCTKNPKTNADFIENQILVKKSKSALSGLDSVDYTKGLTTLYEANYDNPYLSYTSTRKLLLLLKDSMEPEEFVKHAGLLDVGVDKKK